MIRLLKILFEKHRQHFLTVAFIFGFIVDNLTLTRVDQLFDNAILLTYVFLAMGSLLFYMRGVQESSMKRPIPHYVAMLPWSHSTLLEDCSQGCSYSMGAADRGW